MIKKISSLIIICFSLILFGGCWDRVDISEEEFVIGIGFDYLEETDEYELTLEFAKNVEGGQGGEIESGLLSGRGKTFHKAFTKINSGFTSIMSLSHCRVIILGDKMARKGIYELVDNAMREEKLQNTVNFIVAKDAQASEIFKQKPVNAAIMSFEAVKLVETESKTASASSKVPIYTLLNSLSSDVGTAVVPTIEIKDENDEKKVRAAGLAVFNKNELAGYLNSDEAMAYSFVMGKIKSGPLENKEDSTALLSTRILHSRTAIKEKLDDKIHMQINIKTRVSLNEIHGDFDSSDISQSRTAEQELGEALSENVAAVIAKVQDEFGCDIFGFGGILADKHRREWKFLKENWPQEFKNIDVSVISDVEIVDTSHSMKKKA